MMPLILLLWICHPSVSRPDTLTLIAFDGDEVGRWQRACPLLTRLAKREQLEKLRPHELVTRRKFVYVMRL